MACFTFSEESGFTLNFSPMFQWLRADVISTPGSPNVKA